MEAVKSQAARVTLEHVSKRFGKTVAVDDVSLQIEPGSLVTLLGPSGCGKTTILRMVAGLETTTNGRVFIGDAEVTHLPPNARDVTMMFQSYALFPHLSVFENVAYGLRVLRRPEAELRKEAEDVLALVGMAGMGERSPNALSGGQQQRVALARSLVMQPKVLLFDEPLSNLDAKLRKRMREEIRLLQQRLGITAIYVTHDQAEALAISDRIVVIEKGRIVQIGSPLELYRSPGNRFVAEFHRGSQFPAGAAGGDGRRPRQSRHRPAAAHRRQPASPGGCRHGPGASRSHPDPDPGRRSLRHHPEGLLSRIVCRLHGRDRAGPRPDH